MEKNQDKLGNLIKKFMKNSKNIKPIKTQCLSEETIACYLDNLLDESEKEKAEKHLALCEPCLDQVIQLAGGHDLIRSGIFFVAPLCE